MILRLLITLLLLPSLACAGQGMGPGPGFKTYSAGGGSPTVAVDNITARTGASNGQISNAMFRGNSFKHTDGSGSYEFYSFSVMINSIGGANTIECRLSASTDFSSPLATGTLAVSTTGEKEVIASSNPTLTDNTTYYAACGLSTATPTVYLKYDATSSYADGIRLYGTAWSSVTATADGDMLFKVTKQ